MKSNMGTSDRIIRLLLAVVFVLLGYSGGFSSTLAFVFYGLAAIMIITSLVKFCPLYFPFGISTCKTK